VTELTLIVDSREQLPLSFPSSTFSVERAGLNVGDYQCRWGEKMIPIAFERKSLGDLFGTMTNGYERFRKEMERAKDQKIELILLIEKSMREVAKGYEHSRFSGDSMLMKLATLHVKYGLSYHFFNDRFEMTRFITETFKAVNRHYQKEEKHGAN
jgi:ERCC4-type nuclease